MSEKLAPKRQLSKTPKSQHPQAERAVNNRGNAFQMWLHFGGDLSAADRCLADAPR